jgi:hypothetical protein
MMTRNVSLVVAWLESDAGRKLGNNGAGSQVCQIPRGQIELLTVISTEIYTTASA